MSQILRTGTGGGGGGSVTTVPTDSGTAVPVAGVLNIITDNAANAAGSSTLFTGSGDTVQLHVTDADFNTFVGQDAGNLSLTSATLNAGFGFEALQAVTSGSENTALGAASLGDLTTGSNNVAVGDNAGTNLLTGGNNTLLGQGAGTNYTSSESHNILISNTGVNAESNVTRIGDVQTKFFAKGIAGVNVGSVATVVTEASDQLGTAVLTAGSGVTITPGANTITISATGSGGTVTTLDGDTGSATPSAGVITVFTNVAANDAGATVLFHGSGSDLQLFVSDANSNTFIGNESGSAALSSGGSNNTALGEGSLKNATTSTNSIAIGNQAGSSLTGSESNTINIGNTGLVGVSNLTNIGTTQITANIAGDVVAYTGATTNTGTFNARSTTASSAAGALSFFKYHGTSTAIQSGDGLGGIFFDGYDGTGLVTGASIQSFCSGTVATNRVAGNLVFAVHPDSTSGGGSATTALTINPNGSYRYNSYGAGAICTDSSGNVTAQNSSNAGYVLTAVGTSSIPVFAAPAASSITITGDSGGPLTGNSFTFTGGTTGLTFAGAGTTETLGGTLVVSNGGTGRASLTNHSLIVGAGTSAVTQLGVATNGQIPIGSTGADPVLATISAGTGITIANGAGSITISASGSGFTWNDVTGGSATLAAENGYIADSGSLTTFTMPTNNSIGDTIKIVGKGSGGWTVVYGALQNIKFGSSTTTTTTGSLSSTNANDCIELVCTTASVAAPIFTVVSSIGNITVV